MGSKRTPNRVNGDRPNDPFPKLKPRHLCQRKTKPRKARNGLYGIASKIQPPSPFWNDVAHAVKDDGRVPRFDKRLGVEYRNKYHDLPEPE